LIFQKIIKQGADIRSLCTEAAMGPVRDLSFKNNGNLKNIKIQEVDAINKTHFLDALETVLPSVSQKDLKKYIDWNDLFGSFRKMN
jgi:SpoVK/Ycf46/Vps4 family AAA+-type ATPase